METAFFKETMSLDSLFIIIYCLMTEIKVVLFSKNPPALAMFAESIVNLLFPFKFKLPFIPFLPVQDSGYLNAPFNYLMGMYANDDAVIEEALELLSPGTCIVIIERDDIRFISDDL